MCNILLGHSNSNSIPIIRSNVFIVVPNGTNHFINKIIMIRCKGLIVSCVKCRRYNPESTVLLHHNEKTKCKLYKDVKHRKENTDDDQPNTGGSQNVK
jgi:hypothetical protein